MVWIMCLNPGSKDSKETYLQEQQHRWMCSRGVHFTVGCFTSRQSLLLTNVTTPAPETSILFSFSAAMLPLLGSRTLALAHGNGDFTAPCIVSICLSTQVRRAPLSKSWCHELYMWLAVLYNTLGQESHRLVVMWDQKLADKLAASSKETGRSNSCNIG